MTQAVFNVVPKNPQVEHIAPNVKPATVQEDRSQKNLRPQGEFTQTVVSRKVDRDYTIGGYERPDTLAKGKLVKEDQYVYDYQRDRDNWETAGRDCIL